ncbi:DHA2 family efflux MFS transporter permease subunit [Xenorhabdus thuongxuanensis]|uniref:Multidrug resistance translocase n=1 Tax=Xenorhabdus thuongxuanensis TaxID=1873484 RepID=A0A1Q5U2C3_9GAMM|nr:DHA2 family efflux MFS transporter permease subunit [Xenorhabdus thuongxuanensis]OKP06597.1 multidrug resistance translocase [Xenorhabdus thuongxuanensis]
MRSDVITVEPECPKLTSRQWCTVVGGLIGGFMAILDIQITNSSMKVIQGALSASLDESSWLMTSYFTSEIIAIPLCGWLCQAFGTGRYALWCIIGFLATSLLCSSAWSLNSMIIFRSLQGFCGGALIPISFRLIIEFFPQEKRPLGMSLFSVISTFAPAVGPALGGWLTENLSWHAIFYINAVPALLSLVLINCSLKYQEINWNVIRKGDFIGIISIMLCLGSLIVVLEKGSILNWFESDIICILTAISTVGLIVFIYNQSTYRYPLINIRLFKDFYFSFSLVIFFIFGLAIYGTLFLVSYYLTRIYDYNASQIGGVVVLMGLPQLIVLPFIPFLVQRFNPKYLICIGFSGLAISAFMNSSMDGNFAGSQMIWSMLIRALGQPFIMVPLSLLATRHIQQRDSASSAVLINIFRSLGGSCGTAMLTTFFISRFNIHIYDIKTSLLSSDSVFIYYLSSVKNLMVLHGLQTNSQNVKHTAIAILGQKMTQQAQIMAFNDLFLIMGGIMLITVFWVLFSTYDFKLYLIKKES